MHFKYGLTRVTLHKTAMPSEYLTMDAEWSERTCKELVLPNDLDGEIKAFYFGSGDDAASWFFCLLDELTRDPAMNTWHKELVLRAWKEDRIVGLCMEETPRMYNALASQGTICGSLTTHGPLSKFFMRNTRAGQKEYVLPCFLVSDAPSYKEEARNGHIMEFMWVAERVRRCGIGDKLEQRYPHDFVCKPSDDSRAFFTAMGYTKVVSPRACR